MQSQQNEVPIEVIIQQKYSFLNEEEINLFMSCHPWLKEEKDPSIVHEYLHEHFQGLAVRYNSIVESLKKIKNSPPEAAPPQEQNGKGTNVDPNNQDGNKPQANLFEEFLNNIQELYKDIFELKNQRLQFFKIVRLLDNLMSNLLTDMKNPAYREFKIVDPQFKEDNLIIIINSLGFEISSFTEEEIQFVLSSEPPVEYLTIAVETLRSLYINNPQFMEEVNKDPIVQQRLEAKKQKEAQKQNTEVKVPASGSAENEKGFSNFLASKHEQRLQQTYHPSSVNRILNDPNMRPVYQNPVYSGSPSQNMGNQNMGMTPEQVKQKIYNTNSYLPDPSNIKDQINEYRLKMQGKTTSPSTNGPRSMTLSQLNERERQADQIPQVRNNSGFGGKVITGREIENMRIEEDKVRFGLRALELTNQFRIANGLQPVVWSQELCDIGMQHSRDMAEGRVPFGHQNFQLRCNSVSFYKRSMSENVAYNAGFSDPPKAAVDGWINSPGHRKNLLSVSNVCGIACYRATNGSWYFTQLFALRL